MKKQWMYKAPKMILFVLLASTAFGFIIEHLWNWLTPPLFGWHAITFWQAIGLFILSKVLFGGFHRGSGNRGRWKQRMGQRWEQMSPEEREKFRASMRNCGRGFAPKTEAQS